ncbi:MAG: SIS domain-containing protein [Oscillospiraceae bacterium]|jgi:uncharacterized phosphosugar-binding protein|nr:SIS domain-containing protein [Oscillospiraceae bacterium]
MDYISEYIDHVTSILQNAKVAQHDALLRGAELLRDVTLAGGNIFAFGCSHAGLLALELYYRTGGMANINPIRAPGLNLDVDPATFTSQIERLEKYGGYIIDASPLKAGDVIIVHSVSGRNTVTVDVAMRAREKGAKVIALTNMTTTTQVSSRHPSGKSLYQCADIVIDNCGDFGDSSIPVPGIPEKVGPTSTAVGAALLYAVVVQASALIAQTGVIPPVFVSANVEGGDAHNAAMLKTYKEHIFYMGH